MLRAGIVVIGRNEGELLRKSLESPAMAGPARVYVDSGSSDGSPALARSLGWDVLELDAARPFSAARGRNEGFDRLLAITPDLDAVQFVDGDCILAEGWLDRACRELEQRPELAIVAGRLNERNAQGSVYNRLCEMEWDVPPGDAEECGGVALMRASAFRQAGGFRPGIVAGEEPELCFRLRSAGWKIARLDAPMASHDAAMTRFSQWWTRSVRTGTGFAQATALHGSRFYGRANLSIVFWTLILPLAALSGAWPSRGWSLLLFAAYPLLVIRIAIRRWRENRGAGAWLYAVFCVLGKAPQLMGQLRYLRMRRSLSVPAETPSPHPAVPADPAAGKR